MPQTLTRRGFLGASLLAFCGRAPVASANGLLETSWNAEEGWFTLDNRSGFLLSYNGQIPGPLLTASPGDTVRISLTNRLTEHTNLHFHGLHVPPSGNADNAFLMIEPGESCQYEFAIPQDHPSGTFWIHPHVHGRSADQVSRGLAAPLIVRGGLDAIPEIAAAPESLLLFQDFDLGSDGVINPPSPAGRIIGREGNSVAASGFFNPALTVEQNGWLRLRVVNASASRFYRLKLEEHTLFQIASDGGALPEPRPLDELLLVPGQRAEFMIAGSRPPGTYRLLNLPYNRGSMGMMARPIALDEPRTIATLQYSGRAERPIQLPASLADVVPLARPARLRTFTLGQGMAGGMFAQGMAFTINGRTFDPGRVDTRVRLGDVEDWEFINPSMMDHPMHIHTNPFQVVQSDGSPERAWRDVVLVPAGRSLRVRTAFRDFTGKLVYHCHILDHEDLGMMAVLEIAD